MPTFAYEFLDQNGKTCKGELDAASSDDAMKKLRGDGVYPTALREQRGKAQQAAAAEAAEKKRKKKGEAEAPKPKGPFIINVDPKGKIKLPSPPPLVTDLDCPKCQNRKLNLRSGKRGPWLGCSGFPKCRGRETWTKLPEEKQKELEKALAVHDAANPGMKVFTMDGRPVESGMVASDFILPGGVQELAVHADAVRAKSA